jgi:hypothetical protein
MLEVSKKLNSCDLSWCKHSSYVSVFLEEVAVVQCSTGRCSARTTDCTTGCLPETPAVLAMILVVVIPVEMVAQHSPSALPSRYRQDQEDDAPAWPERYVLRCLFSHGRCGRGRTRGPLRSLTVVTSTSGTDPAQTVFYMGVITIRVCNNHNT